MAGRAMTTACHPSYSSQATAAIIIAMSISIPTRKRVKYCVLLTPSPPYCSSALRYYFFFCHKLLEGNSERQANAQILFRFKSSFVIER